MHLFHFFSFKIKKKLKKYLERFAINQQHFFFFHFQFIKQINKYI
ncbi:hypothetical protein RB653_006222 [Dictyostelium firmibasis]|uniref:Uncharacterized protein n=1 Tax=Dictyostelium firmibasis TaxID=79012 RepID=A0AAN7UD29_9MYCE